MSKTARSATGVYEEKHSALNRSFMSVVVLTLLAVALFVVLAVTVSSAVFSSLTGAVLGLLLILMSLLYRNWPTGIRVDETGITFGAIGSRRARAGKRRPTVNHQSWGLFHCPWPSVVTARVATDPAEILRLRKSNEFCTLTNRWGPSRGMQYCSTGVLSAPLMTAALVIEIGGGTTYPDVRNAKFYDNFARRGYFSRWLHPKLSPTWVVPTRHPEALAAALAHWEPARAAQPAGRPD